jgi:predicted porin
MKKLLIATAALAMVAGTAQAQSSVSVYGSIDASYGDVESKQTTDNVSSKASGSGLAGASSSGSLTSSRLGFRGREDLGGGLAAQFNLEYALANGTGTTTTTNIRTSTVGLSSNSWGSFNIGRQLTGIHNVLTATSPISGSNMAGDIMYSDDGTEDTNITQLVTMRMHKGDGFDAVRTSNSIAYVTPSFSGFTARVDYAADAANADSTVATNDRKLDVLGLSGTYNQGPLLVTAGTHTMKGKTPVAAVTGKDPIYANLGVVTQDDAYDDEDDDHILIADGRDAVEARNDQSKFTVDAVAARYTMGATKFNVIYAQKEQSYNGLNSYKADAMSFGVSHDIGKVTLAAQYGTGTTKFGQAADANGAKVDSTALQLAAIYSLSKRTNVYAAYGQEERKLKTDSIDAGAAGTVGDKTERSQFALGLRHSF